MDRRDPSSSLRNVDGALENGQTDRLVIEDHPLAVRGTKRHVDLAYTGTRPLG